MIAVLARRSRLCQWQHFKNVFKGNIMTTESSKVDEISNVFKGESDRYKGITVNSQIEKCEPAEFQTKLEESMKLWRSNEHRTIWFRVSLDESDWVPILAKKGFRFHHAKDDYVMMYIWLPLKENCNIPPYAHTLMGVGAVVVNDNRQILVVSEKYFPRPHLKLPGGYVEPGENLVDAAIREVLEETNVRTEFQTVLSLRHAHHAMFGCSDLYSVVSLKPLSDEIKKCESEIAHAQWMDLDEYLEHPHVHELNRFFVQKYLEYSKRKIKVDWQHGIHQIIKVPYTVYFVSSEEEEPAGRETDEK